MSPAPRHGSTQMKRARAWWARIIQATPGGIPCVYRPKGNPRCRGMITSAVPWDLAHDDDRPGAFLGPACRPCNRGKFRRAGRKGFGPNARSSTTITRELSDSEQREQDRRERVEQRERERRQRQRPRIVTLDDDEGER